MKPRRRRPTRRRRRRSPERVVLLRGPRSAPEGPAPATSGAGPSLRSGRKSVVPPASRHELLQVRHDRPIELDLPQLCTHPPRQIVEIASVDAALAGDNVTGINPRCSFMSGAWCRPCEAREDASRSLVEELPRQIHSYIVARERTLRADFVAAAAQLRVGVPPTAGAS